MGFFDFLMGPSGKDGASIESATADASGKMTLTMSDSKKYYVDLPAGRIGPSGNSVKGVSINDKGELIFKMSDGAELNAGSIKGPQGIPGVSDPALVSTELTKNNEFINNLGKSIAQNSSDLSKNVVTEIGKNTGVLDTLKSSIWTSPSFTDSVANTLTSNATYKQRITGPIGAAADKSSLYPALGWAAAPVIKTSSDNTGTIKAFGSTGGSVKGLWCADGVQRWKGNESTSTICTAPGDLKLHYTDKYSGVGEQDNDAAEISNDRDVFKKLMLVGNKKLGGKRTVGVYDNLDVAGDTTTTNITVGTNIISSDGDINHQWTRIANTGTKTAGLVTDMLFANNSIYGKNISAAENVTAPNVAAASLLDIGSARFAPQPDKYWTNLIAKDGSASAKGLRASTLHSWGDVNADNSVIAKHIISNTNRDGGFWMGNNRIEDGDATDPWWRLVDRTSPKTGTPVYGKGFAAKNLYAQDNVNATNVITKGLFIGNWQIDQNLAGNLVFYNKVNHKYFIMDPSKASGFYTA